MTDHPDDDSDIGATPGDEGADRPVIRLRPKADARRLRHGHPWAFADELVLDRRTKALAPGAVAVLEDAARTPLATVAVNPGSKIAARVLDPDPTARIDRDWIAARVTTALAHRDRLYDRPFYRLIHAEADGLPGVVVDRFGDILSLQPNAAWAETLLDPLTDALTSVTGCRTVVKNAASRGRALEGLDAEGGVIRGQVDGPVEVEMNGARYMADLIGGQKTGLFYDQRETHAFVARLADAAQVLDVFTHVGGFALAALARGATSALAVDSSAPALDLAARGAAASGTADRFETRQGDGFDTMAALGDEGRSFDIVISDPPAFAPAKPALEKGLRAYERLARLAAPLVRPGGYLVLCSCSHAATLELFRRASLRGVGRAGRVAQVIHEGRAGPDHPEHPALGETGYLKAIVLRLIG